MLYLTVPIFRFIIAVFILVVKCIATAVYFIACILWDFSLAPSVIKEIKEDWNFFYVCENIVYIDKKHDQQVYIELKKYFPTFVSYIMWESKSSEEIIDERRFESIIADKLRG